MLEYDEIKSERTLVLFELQQERSKVILGVCPECGNKLEKKRDLNQFHSSSVQGHWYKVKCDDCKYRADWIL